MVLTPIKTVLYVMIYAFPRIFGKPIYCLLLRWWSLQVIAYTFLWTMNGHPLQGHTAGPPLLTLEVFVCACACVCACVRVCVCVGLASFFKKKKTWQGILIISLFWGLSTAKHAPPLSEMLLYCREPFFTQDVTSFPPFVLAWMWMMLFQQYTGA